MAGEAVVTPPAGAAPVNVKESPEFQEAMKAERERMRLDFDAEYRRKQKELEEQHRPPANPPANGQPDWFEGWAERHGLPANAGRELVAGAVEFVQGQVLPGALKPLNESAKRSELRSQRQELRQAKPKLARLDDRYHGEVMKLLGDLDPRLVGPDSYAKALSMVIGDHVEELETERTKEAVVESGKERESAPGPEPLPNAAPSKPKSVTLNAKQKVFCEEKGMAEVDFVEMMVERARRIEAKGNTKAQVRMQLGELLGSLEF